MRAYYLTSERWALEAIKLRRLKLSLFNDMNDPFELLGMELKTPKDRSDFYSLKEDMNRTIGALCFSRNWNDPVLWSHYGDRHRGICLGFDIPDDWAFEINYQAERLKEDLESELPDRDYESLGHKLLTTKFERWHYEDEVRMILKLEDALYEDGRYFLPFCSALRLREIVIGPRNSLEQKNINKIVSDEDNGVSFTKSRLAFNSYKVVKKLTPK